MLSGFCYWSAPARAVPDQSCRAPFMAPPELSAVPAPIAQVLLFKPIKPHSRIAEQFIPVDRLNAVGMKVARIEPFDNEPRSAGTENRPSDGRETVIAELVNKKAAHGVVRSRAALRGRPRRRFLELMAIHAMAACTSASVY